MSVTAPPVDAPLCNAVTRLTSVSILLSPFPVKVKVYCIVDSFTRHLLLLLSLYSYAMYRALLPFSVCNL